MESHQTKIEVFDRAGVSAEVLAKVTSGVSSLPYLNDVVRWCAQQDEGCAVEDVVAQDEFTHDVTLSYGLDLFLVFDAT